MMIQDTSSEAIENRTTSNNLVRRPLEALANIA